MNELFNLRPYLDGQYEAAPRAMALSPDGDLPSAQAKLRQAFSEVLNLRLYGPRGAVAATVLETADCGDYTRTKLALTIAPSLTVPLYILRPAASAGKLPAVLALNGHGRGVCDILGIDDVFGRPEGRDYQKQFAVELVKRGMLVAAPEIIGFGESRIYDHINGEGYGGDCSPLAGQTLLTGGSIGGLRVYEMQRVLDYVVSLPEFDGKNLGCIGISGGGTVTTNLAAVDLRVTAAVVSGYANFYKTSICAVSHCIDNYLPSILRYAEMPDLLGLIAPRPLMISSGSEDRIFPVAATRRAVEKLSALYAALGCPENLETDYFEGGHMISGPVLFDFFSKRFGL